MVNIGYRAARAQGKVNRELFCKLIPNIIKAPIASVGSVPARIYALSCERDFPEQVASLRSFLRCVGIPQQFTIVSDGSYSESSLKALRAIHSCVEVTPFSEFVKPNLPGAVFDYATQNPMGKKLATILSIPVDRAALYVDSDVLFFAGATAIADLIVARDRECYYLPDSARALDFRLLETDAEAENPVNGGFILLKRPLDWTAGMERFLALKEPPNYFSEQTVVHLTMHHNRALPLPPDKYIMARDDEFIYRDRYAGDNIVLRHYVNPVRHKLWFSLQKLL
ncbi:hypothetical protein [Oscillatoria sp. FACHB-1406]|uniref:hypothetical protein n=1 Tax=Oscillatoria sp. FACHB-1406 TaxID=2692846 RepID=UPI001685D061|nr:hypothetical protein [Oscillatoria sp. FACHB-1406]MBD2579006.1 hypothetical protein [Oscillatoria sp. FACHB-1406]